MSRYDPVEYHIVHADGVDILLGVDACHAFTEADHEFDGVVSVQRLPKGRVFTRTWLNNMIERRDQWRQIWQSALYNMPRRKGEKGDGRQGALARCLEMPTHTKTAKHTYVAHTSTYRGLAEGRKPRDQAMQQRLRYFAGPHGKLLAQMKLTVLGLAHLYTQED